MPSGSQCPECGGSLIDAGESGPLCLRCFIEGGTEEESAKEPEASLDGHTIGRFRVLHRIGGGGMGVVYLAEDEKLERKVALKFPSAEAFRDPVNRRRFEREAKAAAALDHPFIGKIYDTGEVNEVTYIAMEYVDGETLQDRLARGPLPIGEVIEIAEEVSDALSAAHAQGIIHRDLKPANIMLTADGHVKVMDFGIAKHTAPPQPNSRYSAPLTLTAQGTTVGTVPYMSPEQLKGEAVDTRADIFSFGIILYEMLAGAHPFQKSDAMQTVAAILTEEPAPLARYLEEVGDPFQHMLNKMLAKDPADRYQSMREVQKDLRAVSGATTHSGLSASSDTNPRVKTYRAILLSVLVLAVVTGVSYWIARTKRPQELVDDAQMRTEARISHSASSEKSVAVLPFENLSADKENLYRVNGIHGELITALSRIRNIKTIAGNSTLAYRDTAKPRGTIAKELGVATLLTGAVQWEADRIRINAQLIDATTGVILWADTFTRELTAARIFEIQSEICAHIAGELRVALTPEESRRIATVPTQNLAALEAYFRGKERYHFRSGPAIHESIDYLEEAISLDPDFAMAHSMLGRSVLRITYHTEIPISAAIARAERHILKALELDSTQSEVYLALGQLRNYQADPEGAEFALRKAVDLNPNNAEAHARYAWFLERRVGSTSDVARHWRESYELDPYGPNAQENLAHSLTASGQLGEALKVLESFAAENPGSARAQFHLGSFCFFYLGRFDDAIVAWRRQLALDPKHNAIPWVISDAWWNLGDPERAVWWLKRSLTTVTEPGRMAEVRAMLFKIAGDDPLRDEQVLEEQWAFAGNRGKWRFLEVLTDVYLASNRLEEARSRWQTAFPSLFDPSAEVDGNIVRAAKDIARVLIATGEREQANHLIAEALPVARSVGPLPWDPHPFLLESTLHAIAGDERQSIQSIRRYFDAGGSPYRVMLQHELKPLQDNSEFQEIAVEAEAKMAAQLKRIRDLEANGELAPIPEIQDEDVHLGDATGNTRDEVY